MYVREIFAERRTASEYHQLVQELRQKDPEYHLKYFRMTKASFDKLLSLLYDRIIHPPNHRNPICPAERLAVTIRFLTTGGSMLDIAFSYRMHVSTVSGILKETIPAIWDCLSPVVLRQPTKDEWEVIRKDFDSKWNFPNAVGCIDGKHFAIICPDGSGSEFYNYKGFCSLIMLVLADAHYRFILVDIGVQGRLSDGSFFRKSDIRKSFENNTLDLPSGHNGLPLCIVGDAAFPLRPYLMRPYPGRQLNETRKVFNYRLLRARRCVENVFGILVSRWRCFLGTVSGDVELLTDMVKAAVCLHNFLLSDNAYCPNDYGGRVSGDRIQEGGWRQTIVNVNHQSAGNGSRSAVDAMQIRDTLADYFMSPTGSLPWQLRVVRRC
ncbi:hypothetical protein HPB49_000933 [Dermacentor silvarum]|uniref:Uncharacterized protein n=2 Tax=Dermacentor silvarum TaxID=543639 RepID=A0ACB8D9Q6_DERSI|nr:uncharacterized protein LOC125943499 [Dermacentor silvarum]KAH7964717.1 hypothetical protein HPB49_000933 [Dermacentor silvarum]